METTHILAEIDSEIARLQQVRALLSGHSAKPKSTGKKRHMSAEARARIAAAQKARWAKAKKPAK
jgi:hypothetical protein